MRAKDIMTSPVHTVQPSTPVEAAAELMAAKAVTALPVVDDGGTLVGMVSESDLLWHRVPADLTAHLWAVVTVLARTVPGVAAVEIGAARAGAGDVDPAGHAP